MTAWGGGRGQGQVGFRHSPLGGSPPIRMGTDGQGGETVLLA